MSSISTEFSKAFMSRAKGRLYWFTPAAQGSTGNIFAWVFWSVILPCCILNQSVQVVQAGLPSTPHGYTVERFAKQLGRFLETLDLSEVVLLGHSHGGFVIQQHTIEHPDRVSAMILYSSSAVTGSDFMAAAANGVQSFADRYQAEGPAVLRAWQSVPNMSSDDDYTKIMRDLLPAYFADGVREKLDLEALRSRVKATILIGNNEPFDVRSKLQGLSVPVLVLVGDHDFICGPKWGKNLHDSCSNSELVHFAQSGHFAHLEQPEEFLSAVLAFFEAHKLVSR